MSDALLRWCVDQLHHSFGLEASEDVVRYILSIDNADEIGEYVGDLLQGIDGKKREFIDELLNRWQRSQRQSTTDNQGLFLFAKSRPEPDSFDVARDSQKKSKRKGRFKPEAMPMNQAEPQVEVIKTPIDLKKAQEMNTSSSSSSKKKSKFVNIYAKEGQDKLSIILPGRHACECLAQKHGLVNNCLSCGRIVCEQEGSGPCLFCGSLVCTTEEQEVLQRDSNKSQKLRKKLMAECSDGDRLAQQEARVKAGLEKAIQHKETLLEYDKNSSRRTRVLDDQSDYFATDSNQWLSPGERDKLRRKEEELRELRHASRKDRRITLDFAGRRVIDEGDDLSRYYSKLDETIEAMNAGAQPKPPPSRPEGQGERQSVRGLVNPNIVQAAPEWVDAGGGESRRRNLQKGVGSAGDEAGAERCRLRLQDSELQEMADGGWCLSVHQPWASLLVRGIKRVEGRDWYTSHRGRLWIAAAAKKPTAQEIEEAEGAYRHVCKREPRFPEDYPAGCLLGCVSVADCLSREQYRERLPDVGEEESASPFVLVCTDPQELLVKLPLKGKHKIWKLETLFHQGAKKGLVPSEGH